MRKISAATNNVTSLQRQTTAMDTVREEAMEEAIEVAIEAVMEVVMAMVMNMATDTDDMEVTKMAVGKDMAMVEEFKIENEVLLVPLFCDEQN